MTPDTEVKPITDEELESASAGFIPKRFFAPSTGTVDLALLSQAYQARLSAAEEENKKLREALKGLLDNLIDGDFISETRITAARNALSKGKDDG